MVFIRHFEERLNGEYARPRRLPNDGYEVKIGGFLHLYSGQEAVAVGVGESFQRGTDALVGGPRCHGHALTVGVSPRRVLAEVFGRATGCCAGRAGSVGLADASSGYLGAYHVAGAQAPIGIGAALAFQYRKTGGCAFVMLGDGALNQGSVHESFNLAALYKLPVVFVVEDNGIACGTQVVRHSADPDLVSRGRAYGMLSRGLDGNDVDEVAAIVAEATALTRGGGGPQYLVARTHRLRGFSMSDPMKYRTRKETLEGYVREPITAYTRRLTECGLINDDGLKRLESEARTIVDDALQFAEESPDPTLGSRFDDLPIGEPT